MYLRIFIRSQNIRGDTVVKLAKHLNKKFSVLGAGGPPASSWVKSFDFGPRFQPFTRYRYCISILVKLHHAYNDIMHA